MMYLAERELTLRTYLGGGLATLHEVNTHPQFPAEIRDTPA